MRAFSIFAVICLCAWGASGQQQPGPNQTDVITTDTVLVQTDVMVFDSRGNFVDGLKQDQFALKIDGKPRPISFFERIKAGSRNEEAQLAAARGGNMASGTGAPLPLDRGRTVLFFVDDVHLSIGGMNQTRRLLSHFVDSDMTQNDEAAITSANGQIGFLQQLTGNKTVLRKAIERLVPRSYSIRDSERPPMSEHQALLIEQNDDDVIGYFVDVLVRDGVPRDAADRMVRARASEIIVQSAHFALASLTALHALIRSAAQMPGRKVLFFISDGFFLGNGGSEVMLRLRELTSEAARTGVVIYSVDARGLIATMSDVSQPADFDPTGRLQRASIGEISTSQEALHALAIDTGGRALFNTNDLSHAVTTALQETSTYYLLAWRPQSEEQKSGKVRRIEVALVGRPELIVRSRRGFTDSGVDSSAKAKTKDAQTPTPADVLRQALRSAVPNNSLPVHVSLNFLNAPQRGSILATSMSVSTDSLTLETVNDVLTTFVDIAGLVFDDQGNVVKSFSKKLTIKASAGATNPPSSISYNDYMPIKGGLYQVRVAASDEKHHRVGSAREWIEVPDLDSKTLALSSLIVAEKASAIDDQDSSDVVHDKETSPFANFRLNIDHHFARSSHLRFLSFIYNAKLNSSVIATANSASETKSAPDLAVQLQVFRDGEPVITEPLRKIEADSIADLARVPYAADISLAEMQPGRYILQLTVIDRLAKTSASQRFNFQID